MTSKTMLLECANNLAIGKSWKTLVEVTKHPSWLEPWREKTWEQFIDERLEAVWLKLPDKLRVTAYLVAKLYWEEVSDLC